MILLYGCEYALQKKVFLEKMKNTTYIKFGYTSVFKNEYIKIKIENTNLIRFGVKNPIQNIEIFNKAQHNSLSKTLHECGLYYQSYNIK